MKKDIGLYIHIPFCDSKCPYCDFYSFRCKDDEKERYVSLLCDEIKSKSGQINCKVNTLYIGGGTPSCIGFERLCKIIECVKSNFSLTDGAEITVECNPHSVSYEFFKNIAAVGVNRVSLGLQSANDNERKRLGRISGKKEVENAVNFARKAGIENISLDVMLGIPESTVESLKATLDFCIGQNVPHVSCYILKIEENTPFYKMQNTLSLPDDDTVADMYLYMCEYLEKHGYNQYEISNFSKQGFESRHNLKYWNCEEYLGIGSSAHSFIDGKRFYCEKRTDKFVCVPDGEGGDFSEYAMLKLRLKQGITEAETESRFSHPIPEKMRREAEFFQKNGLVISDSEGIRLTRNGFLLSNTVISRLIY